MSSTFFVVLGGFWRRLIFHVFLIGKKSAKNLKNRACWRPKCVHRLFWGRVCGRGVADGEVRRGQALRSRRMLPEFPENMRTRRFLWGGWGKENLEEFEELEFGELEEGAWILRRRTRVWGSERRHKGDGRLLMCGALPPTHRKG